jgi:hypothetical protein
MINYDLLYANNMMYNIILIDYYDWETMQRTKMIGKLVHDMYLQLQNWPLFIPPNIKFANFH